MKVSFSINTNDCGSYRVELGTMELPDDLRATLNSNVEIFDIILLRESGHEPTTMKVLNLIADKTANFLLQNSNIILFLLCEDMLAIPCTNKDILPQEYRSRLFGAMFEHYMLTHSLDCIKNYPICVNDAEGIPMYMHLFAKTENENDVMIIRKDIMLNYSK